VKLLERASFLQTLAEYAGEARKGDGRLVLVSGESGMGKTALLEEFQRGMKGARWLWGACDGLLTPRPLGPLFDIGVQAGGELADLCRQGAARDRLFAAFQAEIGSSGAFTVAVIEDVHWADEATVDLLGFLGRRLGRMRALLLATCREDELGGDHPLRVVLGDLATQRATRRMRLPPLSEGAVRALVGQQDLDAGELYRVSGGNPFYVSEILEAGWPSVPPTVRDAVGARLARSSPSTRRAVDVAAVIGTRVDWPLLSSVLAGSSWSAEDCLATGIFVAERNDLRFRHELVRMAVEAGIAPRRKAELHARLLAALEDAVMPIPSCSPTTLKVPGMRSRSCGTLRRRPGVRPGWEHIARRRRSSSGRCGSPAKATGRLWRDCTKASRASIRCSTGGRRRSGHCGPRCRCGGSCAMT
jgi:predicted ATPase